MLYWRIKRTSAYSSGIIESLIKTEHRLAYFGREAFNSGLSFFRRQICQPFFLGLFMSKFLSLFYLI